MNYHNRQNSLVECKPRRNKTTTTKLGLNARNSFLLWILWTTTTMTTEVVEARSNNNATTEAYNNTTGNNDNDKEWYCALTSESFSRFVSYGTFACSSNYSWPSLSASASPSSVVTTALASHDGFLEEVYFCNVPLNLNGQHQARPTLDNCASVCALYESVSGITCNSCQMLASGDIAYDYTNLVSPKDDACAERNALGICGQDHSSWTCQPTNNEGEHLCTTWERAKGLDPLLPDLIPFLFCSENDLNRNTNTASLLLESCHYQCLLLTPELDGTCNTCTLLDSGDLAYIAATCFPMPRRAPNAIPTEFVHPMNIGFVPRHPRRKQDCWAMFAA